MKVPRIRHAAWMLAGIALPALLATVDAQDRKTAEAPGRDALRDAFADPPMRARPRVWWHWMNGNVTKDGITRDLEWMRRTGIGGLQNFDAALTTPQVVERRLEYMTPEWKDAFRHTARLADELGLELGIAASPGWSETGGPWVTPEDGIKKLVWSKTEIRGGLRVDAALPAPSSVTGPFQDMGYVSGISTTAGRTKPLLYRDVAVFAHRIAEAAPLPTPAYAASGASLDAAILGDDRYDGAVTVTRRSPGGEAVVEISYARPVTVKSATFALKAAGRSAFTPSENLPVLEALGADGWRRVAELPLLADAPTTVAFRSVTAARFRMRIEPIRVQTTAERLNAAPGAITGTYRPPSKPSPTIDVAELRLSDGMRVDRYEAKAGFSVARQYLELATTASADEIGVPRGEVVDLTSRMDAAGRLSWTPPAGRWRVVRMGWSLTGTTNHPATAEATGLEVDKLDRAAVDRYMTTYLDMFASTVGPDLIGRRGLRAITTDSIEVGAFNWTPGMAAHFRRLRGYEMTAWLPALTGTVVGTRAQTDRFLYDYRRTIADLLASEHYATVARKAHERGLVVYGEALEVARPSLGDDMTIRSHADVPMAAMWTFPPEKGPRSTFLADIKGAASVAHVYGQNLVAAESLTSGMNYWGQAPSDLKPAIDLEFAYGVNRPVIHTSVHQPVERKPGLSLFVFGQYFNRHETWAEMARPWVDYIARSSLLLQWGRNHADLAYFHGEEAPLTGLYNDRQPGDAPSRYAYDFVGADALRDALSVSNGEIVARGGARYRAIHLGGDSRRMTVATLESLRGMVAAGATLIGKAPEATLSIADDDLRFRALRAEMWSGAPVTKVGRGRVIASDEPDSALEAAGIAPDVVFEAGGRDLLFVHRRDGGEDVYFVVNRAATPRAVTASFHVSGREPEIWRADAGTTERATFRAGAGRTAVDLSLAPNDAVFVVFRRPSTAKAYQAPSSVLTAVARVEGPWSVSFEPGRGAPATTTMPNLQPLDRSNVPGIRYFSGIATYRNDFVAPALGRSGLLKLDLGIVGDVATVMVNGKEVGTLWKSPYRIEIGGFVRPGRNSVEVRVANLWKNRLIGDAQPGAEKIAFTTLPTYGADAPLRTSGLIGPVSLIGEQPAGVRMGKNR